MFLNIYKRNIILKLYEKFLNKKIYIFKFIKSAALSMKLTFNVQHKFKS